MPGNEKPQIFARDAKFCATSASNCGKGERGSKNFKLTEKHLRGLRGETELAMLLGNGDSARAKNFVHRLDAGTGVPADVPDALLRFVAVGGGAQDGIFWVVATGGHAAGAAIFIFGGNFVRAGDGADAAEGNWRGANCANDDFARSGDSRARVALSRAGVRARIRIRAVDGFAARGHSQRDWDFDHVDGGAVLGGAQAAGECCCGGDCCGGYRDDDASAVDDASAAMAAVAARKL